MISPEQAIEQLRVLRDSDVIPPADQGPTEGMNLSPYELIDHTIDLVLVAKEALDRLKKIEQIIAGMDVYLGSSAGFSPFIGTKLAGDALDSALDQIDNHEKTNKHTDTTVQ